MIFTAPQSDNTVCRQPDLCRYPQHGYALILALGTMLMLTLTLSILENSLNSSMDQAQYAVSKVQADWACYGGAIRAAMNPPDSLTRFDYYGTRVQVTVHDPPLPLLTSMLELSDQTEILTSTQTESIHLYCTVAASPSLDSSSESTWYFLIRETKPPEIWTSWRGLERSEPYR